MQALKVGASLADFGGDGIYLASYFAFVSNFARTLQLPFIATIRRVVRALPLRRRTEDISWFVGLPLERAGIGCGRSKRVRWSKQEYEGSKSQDTGRLVFHLVSPYENG